MPRVFISYSHDSDPFKQMVLDLANRLRGHGVDAWIDQYLPDGPPEGWPRWMAAQIEQADFVLLVCTEIYNRRVSMNEEPGKGLGAVWESHLVFQSLYNTGTVNPKFIPVLPPGGEVKHIPTVLQGVQRYSPFSDVGYQELYRRLTGQPAVQMPALGKIIVMPPAAAPLPTPAIPIASSRAATMVRITTSNLALLASHEAAVYIPVVESQWDGQKARMVFQPEDSADGIFLDGLRDRQRDVRLAYKGNVATCRASGVQQRSKEGIDRWEINFLIQTPGYNSSMEFQAEGLTPDRAAVLRAERLLLNQHPAEPLKRGLANMREIMIQGQQQGTEILRSPFPDLFKQFGHRPNFFLEAAWITAVMQLKLGGTVEHVSRFELTLDGRNLQVQFEGRRHKYYSNVPAAEVKVSGTCTL